MSAGELEHLELLGALPPEELDALADELERLALEPGVRLFDEGAAGDAALFLLAGEVELCGSRLPLPQRLGAGSALGALALVAPGPREVSAETVSHCTVLRLSRDAFRRLCDHQPRAACRLLEALVRETVHIGRDALALAAAGVDPAPVDE